MTAVISEAHVEAAALDWLRELGCQVVQGPDIAHDGSAPERASYRDVVLWGRLRAAISRLNPGLPATQVEIAARAVGIPNVPGLLAGNQQVHALMVSGVPVEVKKDGETRGVLARVVDFERPEANDWLVVSQFTIEGAKRTRRLIC